MIHFGSALLIKAICPDCYKPMDLTRGVQYESLASPPDTGNLACVSCNTKECINYGFIVTIEKKTGMVVCTNARYTTVRDGDGYKWKPVWSQLVDQDGEPINMRPSKGR